MAATELSPNTPDVSKRDGDEEVEIEESDDDDDENPKDSTQVKE